MDHLERCLSRQTAQTSCDFPENRRIRIGEFSSRCRRAGRTGMF